MKNLLGSEPPPPPPDVPALEDQKVDAGKPLRDRLLEHRANPVCASCHDLMDPVGFALENYDAIGRYRRFDGLTPIDATGSLPGGASFDGIEGLEVELAKKPEAFVRTLSEKLLTFALGRGVEYYAAPAIRRIVRESKRENFRFLWS